MLSISYASNEELYPKTRCTFSSFKYIQRQQYSLYIKFRMEIRKEKFFVYTLAVVMNFLPFYYAPFCV